MKTISSLRRTAAGPATVERVLRPEFGNAELRPGARARSAFTLIEILGVLAVLMILALALVPALIKQLDQAMKDNEAVVLQKIADGLRSTIVNGSAGTNAYRWIPGTNTFYQDVSAELGWLVSDVATNARGNKRIYAVHPNLRLGPSPGATLPYTNGLLGSMQPTNARVMIVSSLGPPLPATITNGTLTAANFERLWGGTDGVTPPGWTAGGDFSDIKIQRVALDQLFVQLTLNKNGTAVGHYTIDSFGTTNTDVPSSPFNAYFISGTVLGLLGTDGILQARQIMQEDSQFWYDKGVWRAKLLSITSNYKHTGADLQAAYEIFMSGQANPNAKGNPPVTQAQVVGDMYRYLSNYVYWKTNGNIAPVRSTQTAMQSDTANYIWKAGQ